MNADEAAPALLDTNILVYAVDTTDGEKHGIAKRLIADLSDQGNLRLSTQILQETFVTLTRKLKAPVQQALSYLDLLAEEPVVVVDFPLIRTACELHGQGSLSFWDALIVAAAVRCGAKRIYTEDLQHGRKIAGVEIRNPFRA